nr:head-tail connector protein [Reyranella sp.]
MLQVKVVTAPAIEPITLTEAKLHCKVDLSTDDDLITALIVAAREEIERRTWRALI